MKYIKLVFIFFGYISNVFSQTELSIEDCEKLFLKNNLLLLAEKFNIDASKASVIQAKIWDLPYISGELNLLNPQNRNVLDIGKFGQKALAVQQLIYLGGKKKNEIEFAKSNVVLSEIQFEQLLRNLKFQITQSFYEIFYNQVKVKSIGAQMSNIDSLITVYSEQEKKGNVPLKDVVRLQSLFISFRNELLDIQKSILLNQENLRVLTNTQDEIFPKADNRLLESKIYTNLSYDLPKLQEIALQKNPEYISALKVIENSELMLKWQKSLAVPDLTAGLSYDQKGGAFSNQVNMTFGIPISLWNRNKGNIQLSEVRLQQSKVLRAEKETEIKSRVITVYNSFQNQQKEFLRASTQVNDFDSVYSGVLLNFQKRNISLIEFTDFMESYNQSNLYINELKKQIVLNGENLNFITNEKVF